MKGIDSEGAAAELGEVMDWSLPNMVRLGMAAPDDGELQAWAMLFAWVQDVNYLPLGEDSD